jgi:hypothetical protein
MLSKYVFVTGSAQLWCFCAEPGCFSLPCRKPTAPGNPSGGINPRLQRKQPATGLI